MADDGRQQQDQPPPRRRAAFPSPQPYQPRRNPQPPATDRQPQPQPRQAGSRLAARGRGGQAGTDRGRGAGRGVKQAASAAGSRQPAHVRRAAAAIAPSVEALAHAASDATQPVAARVAALQQLHQQLFDSAAQREALQQLQTLWPRLLALLCEDTSPAVSAAAAPAVGAVGALTAQAAVAAAAAKAGQSGPAGAAGGAVGGLLFDWLLPVLQRRAAPGGQPLAAHHQAAALAALRDCMAGVDGTTLARYANAVLAAAQTLLEDEAAPPAVLPPLLATVQQAARHQLALKPRFRDLVDLLLGWALEPALPDAARPELSRTLAAFGPQWRQQPSFAASLLGSLLADMQRLADKAAAEADSDMPAVGGPLPGSLRQVLALAACVLPILDAAAAARVPSCQQCLLQLLQVVQQAVQAAVASGAPAGAAAVAELAGHVAKLSALAPAAAAAALQPASSSGGGSTTPRSPGATHERVVVQLAAAVQALDVRVEPAGAAAPAVQLQLAVEAQPDVVPGLRQLFAAVVALAGAAVAHASVLAQPAAVLAMLGAVRSWSHTLMKEREQLVETVAAELLPAPSQPSGSSTWLLGLRGYGSRDVVQQAAELLLPVVRRSPAALEALLEDTAAQTPGGGMPAADGRDAALFNVQLLHAAVPQLLRAAQLLVWRRILRLVVPDLDSLPQLLRPPLLALLRSTSRQLMTADSGAAVGAGAAALAAVAGDALQLLAVLIDGCGAEHEAELQAALHWLEEAAAWPALHDADHSTDVARVLAVCLACTDHAAAVVRAGALRASCAWVNTSSGSSALLREPRLASSLYQAAILHLSDLHPATAAAARALLLAAAAPLALGGVLSPSSSNGSVPDAGAVTLQPQLLGFTPAQLQQWLDWLAAGGRPTALLTAAGQRQAPRVHQWLPRLLQTMQAVAPPAADAASGKPSEPAVGWHPPSALLHATWWAVQEAAKQCVAARLRTHHGGPAQTLAALEQALQATAAGIREQQQGGGGVAEEGTGGPGQLGAEGARGSGEERQQAAALLLLFLHALEQGIAAAGSGTGSRATTPQPAVAFFVANDKVCQAWFARVRPLLLRTAAALQLHGLAAYHALLRLRDLQRHLATLLPATRNSSEDEQPPTPAADAGPLSPVASLNTAQTPQARPLEQRISGEDSGATANPAAALLAATRGSPDVASRKEQQSGATQGPRLSQQQVQVAAVKVADAAAAAAVALCALGDADAVAGLQAFTSSAFTSLLQQLHHFKGGEAAQPDAAPAAAAAAWDWLEAVRHQAAGRYEDATRLYCRLYTAAPGALGPSLQCVPTGALACLAAEAYTALGDAQGLRLWLESKQGAKVPPAVAARCMQLADWDQPAGQPQMVSSELSRLQLSSFDPAAAINTQPSAAAASLALLAAETDTGLHLPAGLLLDALVQPHAAFSAWQQPSTCNGRAHAQQTLPALLLLLAKAGPSKEQQAVLVAAASQEAADTRNPACMGRVEQLSVQHAGTGGAICAAAPLLLRLQRLQAATVNRAAVDAGQAWRLLVDAQGSPAAAAVAPAIANLLSHSEQSGAGISFAEVEVVLRCTQLPALDGSTGPDRGFEQLEQQLLATAQSQLQGGQAACYAALKVAVAAAPDAASSWWKLAAWLHGLAWGQPAALQAAFASCCHALALAAPATSCPGGRYGAMPLLLQLLRLAAEQHAGSTLPPDAAVQLARIPAAVWLPVVPHLMAQLADSSVSATGRGMVERLLLLAADAFPAQVLLPAMVAAAALQADGTAAGATAGLLQQLEQRHPQLARHMRLLTMEAARLAVLPEEHWHSVLLEAAAMAAKRLPAAQQQQAGAAAAEGAGAATVQREAATEAYLAAVAPVLLCLQQQLEAAQATPPETPHERHFRQERLPRLCVLLEELMQPAAKPLDDGQQRQRVVSLLRGAAAELGAALRPKQLALAEVAPALSELAGSGIPMPGVDPGSASAPAVTVAAVGGDVAVLPTKTRPKRLGLVGSDGVQRTYLLKGREDLRADARLMLLLRACRSALRGGGMAAEQCFEVAPLGSRVGLVQWVEGTVPLFEVYTSWQQQRAHRQRLLAAAQQHQQQQQQQQQTTTVLVARAQPAKTASASKGASARGAGALARRAPLVVAARLAVRRAPVAQPKQQAQQQLRPVDLFYAKLKAAGIDPASQRGAWPEAKLVRVLESMQQTVDPQLLWREVWLGASSAADWWQRQRRFADSTAAMSLVGHLLGLGDRHLDNVLLRRASAALVHIDFSVLFDRGRQLKVPELVPFRLTQTLVAALGVTGVEGAFRLGCERTLSALRANEATLSALLGAALRDPVVDWDSEAAAKAASQAFSQAVALRSCELRLTGAADDLRACAAAARAALHAADGALRDFARQFLGAARAATAAAESHALLQRCQATLGSASEQERLLAAQAEEGRAALAASLAEAQPLGAQAAACLRECQAWQQRHDALLPLLLNTPPAALLAGAAAADPAAAASAAGGVPLLLVTSLDGDVGGGTGSVLHAALGVLPAHSPLSAGLLLRAAQADTQGMQLLRARAVAAGQVADALQQYAAAAACLLGGPRYSGSSQHAHWEAAFLAATELPMPQGFQRAAELAPHRPDAALVLAGWRPLAAAAAAAGGLVEQLGGAASALAAERVDLSLAAADARQRMLDAARGCWASPAAGGLDELQQPGEHGAAALVRAIATLSDAQAAVAAAAAAEHHRRQQEEEEEAEAEDGEEGGALLAEVERLVLGYAGTAVALRDATSEELFLSPGGTNLLAWLSDAVQAVDALATAAAELQLLLPLLLALLCSPLAAAAVAAAVAAAADALEEDWVGLAGRHVVAASAGERAEQRSTTPPAAVEQQAAAALAPLLEAAGQHPPFGALLAGLQRVQMAAQLLLPPEERPSEVQQQLLAAAAAVAVWQELEDVVEEAAEVGEGEGAEAAPASGVPWQQCSAVLAEAVAAEAAAHLLPPLATALAGTAGEMRAAAHSLARRAGLEPQAPPPLPQLPGSGQPSAPPTLAPRAAPPDLVPFMDFEGEPPGGGELLEGEAEAPRPGDGAAHGGGSRGGEPGLVPFLDFDDDLAGADDLLEALEPDREFEDRDASQQPGEADCEADGAPSLAALLAAATEASGAVAALDAACYVGGLALQQCRRAAQQHCAELAAFQWVNEHLLPAEAAAAASAVLAGVPLSAAAAADATGAPPAPVHPAVAGWELRMPRQQLLERLRAGCATLMSLEAPLAQWQSAEAEAAAEAAAEAGAVAPWAVGKLAAQLTGRQRLLQGCAAAAAHLVEVGQAVLQLEAARTADADASPGGTAGGPDRYAAEQRDGWLRYSALLGAMRSAAAGHEAAARRAALAAAELEALAGRRHEAITIMRSAEEAGSQAAASFAVAALPLVRATQTLPATVARAEAQLAGCAAAAAQLERMQRWARELAGAGAGAAATTARGAMQRLGAAVACLRGLPSAVQALHAALLPVRNRLLAGGRGEAAAKQQAAEVVDALGAAVAALQPQLEGADQAQHWLGELPDALASLAAEAGREATDLQRAHGFSLRGLERLLRHQAPTEPPASPQPRPAAGALTGSLMLPASGGLRPGPKRDEQRRHAEAVLQHFRSKLLGRELREGGADGGEQRGGEDVPAAVQHLIAAATSPANLARMYEGWMPWV